jgi:hypothetical protein
MNSEYYSNFLYLEFKYQNQNIAIPLCELMYMHARYIALTC